MASVYDKTTVQNTPTKWVEPRLNLFLQISLRKRTKHFTSLTHSAATGGSCWLAGITKPPDVTRYLSRRRSSWPWLHIATLLIMKIYIGSSTMLYRETSYCFTKYVFIALFLLNIKATSTRVRDTENWGVNTFYELKKLVSENKIRLLFSQNCWLVSIN